VALKEDVTISKTQKLALIGGQDNMLSVNKEALCVYSRKRSDKVATAVEDTIDKAKKVADCFPAKATVSLESGASRRMDQVAVGDRVLVGPDVYSAVYGFTHRLAGPVIDYVRLETCCGEVLLASPGHFVHVNGGLVAAAAVRVGDIVTAASGATKRIVSVSREPAQGLYNPQTLQGDIVVNGLVASTYTQAVAPALAHALLTPVRAAYSLLGLSTGVLDSGADGLAGLAPGDVAVY
jgi:desert hedgehog